MQVLAGIPLQSIEKYCKHIENTEQNFIRMQNIQVGRRVDRFIIDLDDDEEIEYDSDEEIEVTDEEPETDYEDDEENKENEAPPMPESPSPCPSKKSCQMPFY